MPSMLSLVAPFALSLPFLGHGLAHLPAQLGDEAPLDASECSINGPDFEHAEVGSMHRTNARKRVDLDPLSAFRAGQTAQQVRIERRVTIRISPRREGNSNSLLARLPQRALASRFEEREMDECLSVSRIAGVQTGSGNRLLLFLDDQRIVTVGLERSCRARDFYSGFYVERREDGKLCVRRDQLHSRSGARCEVERMRELVAVER